MNTTYPGEDAKPSSKRVYRQRLDAYIRKSTPIWRLTTKKDPCPITTDAEAMTTLINLFGPGWTFDHADISGKMKILHQNDVRAHARILKAMEENSNTPAGSWRQRNSALYSAICDTLDLADDGVDLDILDIVEDGNGIALYELIQGRLQHVQSSDPMARAIKIRMGIDHIVYDPKPHGVKSYFAKIKEHRLNLADLPKPKYIQDWEVVAKALHELPPLHPKFESASRLLELQRQMFKQETSLENCINVFAAAESDNKIYDDLRRKKKPHRKRKLATNVATHDKRNKTDGHKFNKKRKYKKGDCVHHPYSTSHCTEMCTNPFGSTSIFALAVDRINKCAAIKKSLAAGWSPKATDVKVPEGFGSPQLPAPGARAVTSKPQQSLSTNTSNLTTGKATTAQQPQNPQQQLSQSDLDTFNRVRNMLMRDQQNAHQYTSAQMPQLNQTMQQTGMMGMRNTNFLPAPPATRPQLQPQFQTRYPAEAFNPMSHQQQTTHAPAQQIRAHVAGIQQHTNRPVSEADLIAAGMQYFRKQAGNQDFRFG